jgi:putative transposase
VNQRRDFLHKLTTKMVTQHTATCTEDLSVKGLARTKLAKSVQDAGMAILLWQLAYKGPWYGTHVVSVDRFYPSPQLCHNCMTGTLMLPLTSETRACAYSPWDTRRV